MLKPTAEIPIPTGPEQIEYQYMGQPRLTDAGVVKDEQLQLLYFRGNADGTKPTQTRPIKQIFLYGQNVSTDPKIKAAVDKHNAAREAAIQQLITDLGE